MTTPTPALICPKCAADMRSYERNGVTIDQCTSCRGVFLDSGELERLVDAEGAFYGSSSDRGDERSRGGYDSEHRGKYGEEHGYGNKGRRRGFLGELFD